MKALAIRCLVAMYVSFFITLFLLLLVLALSGCVFQPTHPLAASAQSPTAPVSPTVKPTQEVTPAPKYQCVQSIGLWLRTEPSVGDNKIFPIANGVKVLVFQADTWAEVFIDGFHGYVRSKYLGDCK
jgi:hypothetical protein